ncbi:LysR family transcriptional regulator [Lacimicrobium alkaliphilum]|uniref:LysR family transcriptional regulator n=1 Tax=Lacimicrobium alkaliphilum TaxID=1526571 RepID=A0A0U3B774_9ALTE|nr:LysR family transcriptional regulator [Lacimicrobium alkaliphilum]ALS97493.1 LysR family transcriptional regulator [Lacimicrobium alkaliphilum]
MSWRGINFDWNRARAFLVTAEEGSFSAAARALNMTQPTLGRQVCALEAELGVTLFERSSRGLILTPSGHDLLIEVRAMADAAGRFSLTATGHTQTVAGKVSISASEATAAFVLPAILARLRQQAPGIEIELIATNDSSNLIRREADIAIRAYRPVQPELIVRKLGDIRAHLYGAKSYLARFSRRTCAADLNGADFLRFDHGTVLEDELNQRGFALTEKNFPVTIASHLVQWELVKAGVGIGFMTEDIGDAEPLVDRALADFPAFEVGLWLVVHRELHTSRRLKLVFDFLAEALQTNS